jgi:hypothetical protein
LTFAKKIKGKAKGPNKIPIANQNGLLAFRFAAIKYKRTPKNAENNIKYTIGMILTIYRISFFLTSQGHIDVGPFCVNV